MGDDDDDEEKDCLVNTSRLGDTNDVEEVSGNCHGHQVTEKWSKTRYCKYCVKNMRCIRMMLLYED